MTKTGKDRNHSATIPDHSLFIRGCKLDSMIEEAEALCLPSHIKAPLVMARGVPWDVYFAQCYMMSDQMAETSAGSKQENTV